MDEVQRFKRDVENATRVAQRASRRMTRALQRINRGMAAALIRLDRELAKVRPWPMDR